MERRERAACSVAGREQPAPASSAPTAKHAPDRTASCVFSRVLAVVQDCRAEAAGREPAVAEAGGDGGRRECSFRRNALSIRARTGRKLAPFIGRTRRHGRCIRREFLTGVAEPRGRRPRPSPSHEASGAAGQTARGRRARLFRIDTHTHFSIPKLYDLAAARGVQQATLKDWTPAKMLQEMEEGGVPERRSSRIGDPGVHFGDNAAARALARECNEFAARVVRDNPTRFGFFAVLPAARRRRRARRSRLRARHAQGRRHRRAVELSRAKPGQPGVARPADGRAQSPQDGRLLPSRTAPPAASRPR